MSILISSIFILGGLAILIYGADALVKGASSMATKWRVPSIVIGLTIVAFGTSAPELVVSLLAAMNGTTDIAIANVVGSNLSNILLILGISACIRPLIVKNSTAYKEIPFAILAMIIVLIVGYDTLLTGAATNVLTRSDGFIFIAFFIIFLYYTYGLSKIKGSDEKIDSYSWKKSILLFIAGLVGLIIGGKFIVDNAIILATAAGLSETLIGLTIIAIGTSLPELATSIVAAKKGHSDIAIGNIVGSNIFNVFWILGITAVVTPLPVSAEAQIDALFTTFVSFLLFIALFVGQKQRLTKIEGSVFLLIYVGYIIYASMR